MQYFCFLVHINVIYVIIFFLYKLMLSLTIIRISDQLSSSRYEGENRFDGHYKRLWIIFCMNPKVDHCGRSFHSHRALLR